MNANLPSAYADLFEKILAEFTGDAVGADLLTYFLSILDKHFTESHLIITTDVPAPAPAPVQVVHKTLPAVDLNALWKTMTETDPTTVGHWKTLAPRVALTSKGIRKLTGYEAFILFKGTFPVIPNDDGKSIIPRPVKA